MARGQSKPSTQGLRDAASLATIGIILNGGERMLVAEPDAGGSEASTVDSNRKRGFRHDMDLGIRGRRQGGGWSCGSKTVRTDHTLVSVAGGKVVVGLVAARRGWGTLVSVAGGKVVDHTLVSVAGGKVVVCKKLEHRSWAAHLGTSLVHWSSEKKVDHRSWNIDLGLLIWGRRSWYTGRRKTSWTIGRLFSWIDRGFPSRYRRWTLGGLFCWSDCGCPELGVSNGNELGVSDGILDKLGLSDGTVDGEAPKEGGVDDTVDGEALKEGCADALDGWRDGALLRTDGAAELAGLSSEGEILVLGILDRLGIPDGTELGVSDGKNWEFRMACWINLGFRMAQSMEKHFKEGCADSIKLGTSEGRVDGMELGTPGGTVDDGAAEVDGLPEGEILVLGLLDKLGIPDGTELGVSDGSADGTELGILDGSADETELAISDSKLDGAALVDGETDGTKLGVSKGKVDGNKLGLSEAKKEGAKLGGLTLGIVHGTLLDNSQFRIANLDGAALVDHGETDGTKLGVSEGKVDGNKLGLSEEKKEGAKLGVLDGWSEGPTLGIVDGALLDDGADKLLGELDGAILTLGCDDNVGTLKGVLLGVSDGTEDGIEVGFSEGSLDGTRDGVEGRSCR
eukprot:scaffold38135_cov31-Attheya_sp.AAC.1